MEQLDKDGLQSLEVWKISREFTLFIYREILPCLPVEEKYNLILQIRRAATSIPANIAEGYGRYYFQSNIQFCYFARGSLEEVKSHLILTHDIGYINDTLFQEALLKTSRLLQLINGYIAYLRRVKNGEKDFVFQKTIREEDVPYNTFIDTETNNDF